MGYLILIVKCVKIVIAWNGFIFVDLTSIIHALYRPEDNEYSIIYALKTITPDDSVNYNKLIELSKRD